jgi:TrmH family RNA methyltransferase
MNPFPVQPLQITSSQNPWFKHAKKSMQSRQLGMPMMLEGAHLVQAALDAQCLISTVVMSSDYQHDAEVLRLQAQCLAQQATYSTDTHSTNPAPITWIQLDARLFAQLCPTGEAVKLLAYAHPPAPITETTHTTTLLLDRVQDPGNLGTILRTAAAAGLKQVYLSIGCADPFSSKALRAGMGAQCVLPITMQQNFSVLLPQLRQHYALIATSSHTSQHIYQFNWGDPTRPTRPIAWLFGNEGQGVSPALHPLVDDWLAIPHLGRMESLNVASSVAICLFEQVRQTLTQNSL